MRSSFALLGKFSKGQSKGVMLHSWGNKNFYKGTGVNKAGRTTRKGGFQLHDIKMPMIEAPAYISPELRPYVSRKTPLIHVAPPQKLTDEEIEVLFQQQLSSLGTQ